MKCRLCKENEATVCENCLQQSKIQREKSFERKVWNTAGKKCQSCWESDKRCLSIHHFDRENHPYTPEKAKLLCLNCHAKIHRGVSPVFTGD